ncbi:MAG TPA: hypothetical protein VJ859_17020 [Allosphingosinicella sp.]|nr:hypothetical protein [Allosphingosinicella sp.]
MLILAILAAAAAPADGKTMGVDDWHAMAIYGVGGEAGGPTYLQVHAGDLDGDGTPDDAVLKLVCADGRVVESSYLVSPRDSASGMPTGKRQYAPVTFVKEWGAASPQLSLIKPTYDVKTIKSARAAQDGWTQVSLSNAEGLCAASQAAAAAIVKSKSNITNN